MVADIVDAYIYSILFNYGILFKELISVFHAMLLHSIARNGTIYAVLERELVRAQHTLRRVFGYQPPHADLHAKVEF